MLDFRHGTVDIFTDHLAAPLWPILLVHEDRAVVTLDSFSLVPLRDHLLVLDCQRFLSVGLAQKVTRGLSRIHLLELIWRAGSISDLSLLSPALANAAADDEEDKEN